jgi:hypothetical protein
MPVPRRRNQNPMGSLPSLALKLLDANFLFEKSKWIIYYGFAPAVVYLGMTKEPCPSSWLELINILE